MRYAVVALIIGVFLLAGSTTQSFANPALTKCRVCGDKVAKEAATCPHCGAPKPWEDRQKDGPYVKYYADGQKAEEIHWKNGKLVSASVWKPDGEPCPITKIVDGSGILVSWDTNDQKAQEVHFKNGVPDGPGNVWENGKKAWEVHCKNGKLDGHFTRYHHANGQKWREGHYKNGKKEGLWTEWHQNGRKQTEAYFKNDKQDGLLTYWNENGQKRSEVYHKEGKLVSATTWKPDGTLCPETKIVDGSGIFVRWYENGKKKSETHFKNGKEVSRKKF